MSNFLKGLKKSRKGRGSQVARPAAPAPRPGQKKVRTQRLSGAERRSSILSVAGQAFSELGYEGTRLDEIASRSGVTKPVIYVHFPGGKRDLYLAVLEDVVGHLIGGIWDAFASKATPRERLRRGYDAYFAFVETQPKAFRLMGEATAEEAVASARDRIAQGITVAVRDVLRASDLDAAGADVYARAVVGAVESAARWWVSSSDMPRKSVVDYLLALTWRGFDGLPRSPVKLRKQDRFAGSGTA